LRFLGIKNKFTINNNAYHEVEAPSGKREVWKRDWCNVWL